MTTEPLRVLSQVPRGLLCPLRESLPEVKLVEVPIEGEPHPLLALPQVLLGADALGYLAPERPIAHALDLAERLRVPGERDPSLGRRIGPVGVEDPLVRRGRLVEQEHVG